ncbi:hypothetical protein ADUPG1_010623 [Aduncisulcus paluster]|uniref:Protein kinase domain-containing protein n=1 Tax=Aduncisulcus paluster TaxID=2918883 RepID=A0ABQ5JSG1_9EUKA|nr:hypothetical protein ADUPG1_010623 [Aduncisulcus paluster]
MEYDKEEKEEFSRSSTQSDHDQRDDPDDSGYMASSTSTHGVQPGSSEKETSIAQDTDKNSVSSVSSVSSTFSTLRSDSASSSLQSTIPHHSSHSDILKKDHGSDSSSDYWTDQYGLPVLPSINAPLHHPSSSEPLHNPSSSKQQQSGKYERISKSDGITLTSADSITPLCIIGHGGFGEVLLVKVDIKGVYSPCVLKKMIHVGNSDLVRKCRKEFKIQGKLYNHCKNRISRPIFILDLLNKEYKGDFGFVMEFCAGGNVKGFARSWCRLKDTSSSKGLRRSGIGEKEEEKDSEGSSGEYSEDSMSDLDSFSHHFDPMTLDPLKVSALCVEIIECLDDVFKANPGFIHRDIKPENFLIKIDSKNNECSVVLSDHGLAQIKRSVIKSIESSLEYLSSDSSSSRASQISSKTSTKEILCGTYAYNSFEALQGMPCRKSDAYSLGTTILALFQCCNPFYNMPVLQDIASPLDFVGKLLELLSKGICPKLSSSPLFASILTINSGEFEPVHTCLNAVFEGLTNLNVGKRMSVHESCEKVQSIKPLLPKIGEGWECPSIDDIVKAQVVKHKGNSGCIVDGAASYESGFDGQSLSIGTSSSRKEEEKAPYHKSDLGYSISSSMATSQSQSVAPDKIENIFSSSTSSTVIQSSRQSHDIEMLERYGKCDDASVQSVVLKSNWDDGLSLSRSSEFKTSSASSSASKEEQLRKEVETFKLRLKREELKSENVRKTESELKSLIVSIKRTESQPAITSLYKESYPRLKAIFDEFTSSSPSAITSNIDLFELCFECLSLFVKHKVPKGDGTLKEDEDDIEVILDSSSIKNIIDTFLPSMIRVEDILRVKEGEEEEEEKEEGGTGEVGMNSITMLLFRIIGIATYDEMIGLSLSPTIFPQISSLISKMFILGLSKKFEDSFIEDILQTCRAIAFATDDPTKNSLLSLLLPHILPWMKKYPDKKFFFLWTNILKNITNDKDNINPHKDRSSQLWFVFHPVLDVIKNTSSKGITFDDDAVIRCLLFFANLSCIPFQAIEVYYCIKDGLLDGWLEMIKKKSEEGKDDGNLGTKHWSSLISMLSTVPSLVPRISPKYDNNMVWCKNNGVLAGDYSRYLGNCYSSLKKWSELVATILKCPDSESTSKLYHEHRDAILSVFLAFQSKSKIEKHKREIVLCSQCLRWFVAHVISGNDIYLPIPDLNDLIDTFIGHLSKCEEVLEGDVDEEYCRFCLSYTYKVKDKWDSFLPKISPTFQRILERGSKEKLGGGVAHYLLATLRNISLSPSSSTRSSILTLIKPYIRDWLRIYNDSGCFGEWMVILSFISLSSDDETPDKSLCSEVWPLFHPVLDVVKREFVGDKIVGDDHERVLWFFSNLCCDPSHAVEIYDNVKNLLDGWFTAIKKEEHEWGIILWSHFISILSTVQSLVPYISHKYSFSMEWCYQNGGLNVDYLKYLENCNLILIFLKIIEGIKKCPNMESISKLYHEHRDAILSVFLAFQSKSKIEEHKREIVLCAQCLMWFVKHVISGDYIYLPIPDLNDLIDTFIGHLSRCEEVLEGDVDEEYCRICVSYTVKVDILDSFLPKISPTFHHILERGSKEKLGGSVASNLLATLRNISISPSSSTRSSINIRDWLRIYNHSISYGEWMAILSHTPLSRDKETPNKSSILRSVSISPSSSTRSSILTLIKPYIRDWLRIYNDSKCYGEWMMILAFITLSSDNSTPNKSFCYKVWPLFHPVLDFVKREFVGDKIVEDEHERVLWFFSSLCCDMSHAVEIYDNVKDLLDGWFTVIKRKEHKWGIKCWSRLISMLSTVPSLVPQLSPKYDNNMEWCKNNGGLNSSYSIFSRNCKNDL